MNCIKCGKNNLSLKDLFWSRKKKPVECSSCHVKVFVPSTLSSAYVAFFLDILGLLVMFQIKEKFNLSWLGFVFLVLATLFIVRLGDFLLFKPQDINSDSSAKVIVVTILMVFVLCGIVFYLFPYL